MIATYQNSILTIAEHSRSKEGQGEALPIPLKRGRGEVVWQLFSDWFSGGKALKEAFFKDMHLDMSNSPIEIEFQKHEAWKEKTQLRATPTILVNGYKLPENYKIEDLRFFMEFTLEIEC